MRLWGAWLAVLLALPCQADLVVSDATVRLLPPGTPNTAAYFTLQNTGDKPALITAASADFAQSVEIHNHVMSGQTMHMEHLASLALQPGEVVQFKPSGLHLMIFSLRHSLAEGQTVTLELQTQSGEKVLFSAIVVKP